jgi:predicted PurR-regulated permease PerM
VKADLIKLERDRKIRRHVFNGMFWAFALFLATFLFFKLKAMLLPAVVGALLAYLFRPLKDRFRIKWLPHELGVLVVFALVGGALFLAIHKAKQLIPDERQKLELKVRLKYKVNEKYNEIVGAVNSEKRARFVTQLVVHEFGPMLEQLNVILALSDHENDLFEKYHEGFEDQEPISETFYGYYLALNKASVLEAKLRKPASISAAGSKASGDELKKEGGDKGWLDALSTWILAPLIFIFMSFDNGQMRRYIIGLVPNRYFELSLTTLDTLDNAIGKYLRGTLLECALVGLTIEIGLLLLGIPFSVAMAIGTIGGLANAIPFLGTAIALIISLAYSLIAESIVPVIPGLNPHDLAIYVVILIGIAHVLDNIVYQPIVLGNAVNLHPLVVIMAIIGGSLLLGVWGMLLAIPTVVVLKTGIETLFKELKDYRII